jgi:hypothetical protein
MAPITLGILSSTKSKVAGVIDFLVIAGGGGGGGQ